jgi:predicted nucleotidyltransferase
MKTNSNKSIIWESSTVLKLLVHFMENPTCEFYGKKVADETGVSVGAAHSGLKKLSDRGILKERKEGRMTFYRLERESEEVKHLKIAYNLSKPVVKDLKKIGEKLDAEIYLYGSVARGEDKEDSDWDILVIGDLSRPELEDEIDSIETDENLKPALYSMGEWNSVEKEDPAFFERVERDKIRLI